MDTSSLRTCQLRVLLLLLLWVTGRWLPEASGRLCRGPGVSAEEEDFLAAALSVDGDG